MTNGCDMAWRVASDISTGERTSFVCDSMRLARLTVEPIAISFSRQSHGPALEVEGG